MTAANEVAERAVPADIAAERVVLGAMMLSVRAVDEIAEILVCEHFYRPHHQTIFKALVGLYNRDEPTDAISVAAALAEAGELARVGGADYLHDCVSAVPVAANGGYYARIVASRATMRGIAEAGTQIAQIGYTPTDDPASALDQAEQIIYGLGDRSGRDDNTFVALASLLQPALDQVEAAAEAKTLPGVPTGFTELDQLLRGLKPQQLITVAGRPSMGKTTLAMDFARHAAIIHSVPTAVFSMEMSNMELTLRLLSAESRVPLHTLQSGQLDEEQWTKLARCLGHLGDDVPLFIDNCPSLSLTSLRSKLRRLRRRHDIKLVIVDFLQLMTAPKRDTTAEELGELSRGLKLIAGEFECAVVAVSQLNRGPEQRTDHRPHLADLRGSGSIEQDSDVVILLHRDDYYDKESPRAGEVDVIVAKHRNGPTDTITLAAQLHVSRFANMSFA